jgi:hypothetical protein
VPAFANLPSISLIDPKHRTKTDSLETEHTKNLQRMAKRSPRSIIAVATYSTKEQSTMSSDVDSLRRVTSCSDVTK